MLARVLTNNEEEVVLEVRISKCGSFLECENSIQDEFNAAGRLATGHGEVPGGF